MNDFKYTLEPYKGMSTRYHCPRCNNSNKTFVRYIDKDSGEYINPDVGKCNRENNCGYHYTPKQYFHDNNLHTTSEIAIAKIETITPTNKPASFIAIEIFEASLKNYENNHFVTFLVGRFGLDIANELIKCYYIGSAKHWEGSTVFWQIDISGRIRSGKVMLYNPTTGKRVKKPFSLIAWAHKFIKQDEFVLKQCFYGEHLLKDNTKPVAIVESEKTAIIASVYLKQFTWLGVGSLNNLNSEKCEVLKGRFVILFPDLNGFGKWTDKAKELSNITTFVVSDLLQCKATEEEKQQGLDLADYLLRYDHKEFVLPETDPESEPEPEPAIVPPSFSDAPKTFGKFDISLHIEFKNKDIDEEVKPKAWDQEIKELDNCFSRISIPESQIRLNPYSLIADPAIFIQSHLDIIKANNGNSTYLPYLKRLQELMQLLSKSLN